MFTPNELRFILRCMDSKDHMDVANDIALKIKKHLIRQENKGVKHE